MQQLRDAAFRQLGLLGWKGMQLIDNAAALLDAADAEQEIVGGDAEHFTGSLEGRE